MTEMKTLTVDGKTYIVVDEKARKVALEHQHQNGVVKPNAIELNEGGAADHGGYIDFHFGGSKGDFTTRLIEQGPCDLRITPDPTMNVLYKVLHTGNVLYLYSVPVDFVNGQAKYENERIADDAFCIAQRRSGSVGMAVPLSTHCEPGYVLINGPDGYNATGVSLNLLIINP